MISYALFYGFLAFISVFDLVKSKIKYAEKIEHFLFFVLWAILVLFIGFRYKMANDWFMYETLIRRIEPLIQVIMGFDESFRKTDNIEVGFKLLISTFNQFFDSSTTSLQALSTCISIFNYSVLIYFTKNNRNIPYKFVFLSLFIALSMFRDFDILRQSLAFYIFIVSLRYFNKSFLKYTLINFLGSFIHISSIIFIPLYFIFKIKFPRPFILSLLILYVSSVITHFSFLSTSIGYLSSYFPDLVPIQKIILFIAENDPARYGLSLVGLIYSCLLIILLINYEKIDFSNHEIRLLINVFLIFFIINTIFADVKEVADRLSYYFYFGVAFIFVYTITLIKFFPKPIIALYLALLIAFPTIRFNRVISDNNLTKIVLVPYRNYLFISPKDESLIYNNWHKKNGPGL